MERVRGIEPRSFAWRASALPLSYTRGGSEQFCSGPPFGDMVRIMATRHWHRRVGRETIAIIFVAAALLAWLLTEASIAVWPPTH